MKNGIDESINDLLDGIKEKYSDISLYSIEDINNVLDRIILEFNTLSQAPKFIITRALYTNEVSGGFLKGKFVIRPAVKYALDICDLKSSFTVANSKNFFVEVIENISMWILGYLDYCVLEKNLSELNACVFDIISKTDCPYSLRFTLGEGIIDIGDSYIVLGLKEEIIRNIKSIALFSEDDYWREKYIEKFKNVLKECNRPYDIVKIKSDITYELDIYNRKGINKLLRKIVSRRSDYVRVGVGYSEDENTFALIEKLAITPEDINNYDLSEVIIEDNESPTRVEKEKGLTKIVIKYKLMPFEKKTNIFVDLGLKEYLDMTRLNEVGVVK